MLQFVATMTVCQPSRSDGVQPSEATAELIAETAASSTQQAFIAILSEPATQETTEEDDGKPKKFDTSELASPEAEDGVKKFDTNELETPAAGSAEVTEISPEAHPEMVKTTEESFGFDGDADDEPLGDVLTGEIPLDSYEATEEQSPLEIEEPVFAQLSPYAEAQVAGSPHSVSAFIDVIAHPSHTPAAEAESATAFDLVDAPKSEAQRFRRIAILV